MIIAPTYDDSRGKIALWNDPQAYKQESTHFGHHPHRNSPLDTALPAPCQAPSVLCTGSPPVSKRQPSAATSDSGRGRSRKGSNLASSVGEIAASR